VRTSLSTRWLRRWVRMLREIPSLAWKSSKRVTPRKASLTMSRLHHSPTTSRHWATEQVMPSKLVRCTNPSIEGCVIERTSLGWVPRENSARRQAARRQAQRQRRCGTARSPGPIPWSSSRSPRTSAARRRTATAADGTKQADVTAAAQPAEKAAIAASARSRAGPASPAFTGTSTTSSTVSCHGASSRGSSLSCLAAIQVC